MMGKSVDKQMIMGYDVFKVNMYIHLTEFVVHCDQLGNVSEISNGV